MSTATAEIPDLWPETIQPHSKQTTPKSILERQADFLGKRTQELVTGEVVIRAIGVRLFHDFYFRAPQLDNYRFLAFTVVQLQHELYPVAIVEEITHFPEDASAQQEYLNEKVFGKECKTETDFTERLRQLFQHERTVRIIDSLIAQSAGE